MGRLEQAKPSPWKGSEQFPSSEASFPILLPIYLVTLPRQRGIQGKCLPLTASVFFFFNVSPCVAGAWPWQWQQKWYFSQDERLPLRQFLRGSRAVLVFHWGFLHSVTVFVGVQQIFCKINYPAVHLQVFSPCLLPGNLQWGSARPAGKGPDTEVRGEPSLLNVVFVLNQSNILV